MFTYKHEFQFFYSFKLIHTVLLILHFFGSKLLIDYKKKPTNKPNLQRIYINIHLYLTVWTRNRFIHITRELYTASLEPCWQGGGLELNPRSCCLPYVTIVAIGHGLVNKN